MRKYIDHGIRLAFSKTAWNTYAIFSSNIVSMAAAFFFIVILVRVLSKEDFGYFSALFSLLLLASDVADFGVGSSLSRFLPPLAKQKEKQLTFLKTAFMVQLGSSVAVAIVLALVSKWVSHLLFHTDGFSGLVAIVGIGIVGSIMVNFFLYAILAKERFWIGSIYGSLSGIVRLAAVGVLFVIGQLYLGPVIWGVSLSFIVLALIGLHFSGTDFFSFPLDKTDIRKLFSYSTFLAIARGLTAIAGRLDVLMIVSLIGPAAAGTYATASRVSSLYSLFSGSFSTVVAPRVSGAQTKEELLQLLKMITLATVGLVASVLIPIIFARFFLVLLFGVEKGAPAVESFRVLLVGMMFFVASIPAVTVALYHLHKPHILTINSFLQLITVAGLNYFFLPQFGAVGAAYSLIVAYAVSFVVTSVMSWYYWKQRYNEAPTTDRAHGRQK